MSLRDRLIKNTTIEETMVLKNSSIFDEQDAIVTDIPALNVALGGGVDTGMTPGILQIAGKSKHFKSKFALKMAKSFMDKFPDGAILFYDSEFGSPESYFEDIDANNVIHTPIVDLDKLIHDVTKQLDALEKNDHLFILIDSLGNMASAKEVEDALKSDAPPTDMTRAKRIKALFRIAGPRAVMKKVYIVVINHVYSSLDKYAKDAISGGSGTYYNSNIIWVIGREQDKDDKTKEILGYDFKINIEKSRFIKEGEQIPISVTFESGIDRWSGLLDLALESKLIIRPTAQLYARADKPETTYKRKEFDRNDEFWEAFMKETKFSEWVTQKFKLN